MVLLINCCVVDTMDYTTFDLICSASKCGKAPFVIHSAFYIGARLKIKAISMESDYGTLHVNHANCGEI
jgi:hypothetical protein